MVQLWQNMVCWSEWQVLEGCWRGAKIPAQPGLYRIRLSLTLPRSKIPYARTVYIGQSGDLRSRIGMLDGIFQPDMPLKAPHVAAPALWAMRHRARLEHISHVFEVSVAPLPVNMPKRLRLGCECVALALHRQHYGTSPWVNYGRLPIGYSPASYNNGPLESYRGSPSPRRERCHLPGLPPAGKLEGEIWKDNWCSHCWSPWINVQEIALPKAAIGLYRLRAAQTNCSLLYVGQGKLRDRLKAYQSEAPIECSWSVKDSWEPGYQEYVDDLVAAHVLVARTIPSLQFGKED